MSFQVVPTYREKGQKTVTFLSRSGVLREKPDEPIDDVMDFEASLTCARMHLVSAPTMASAPFSPLKTSPLIETVSRFMSFHS